MRKNEVPSRAARQPTTTPTFIMANLIADCTRRFADWSSYASRTRGGRSRIGYMERQAENESAIIDVNGRPWMALEMAKRMAQFVKTEVVLPRQLARVKGLKRNLQQLVLVSLHPCVLYIANLTLPRSLCQTSLRLLART